MTFKKTEKEIIRTIVKYGGEVKSLAEVLNKSKLLEKRGIAIVPNANPNFIFLSKDKYGEDEKDALGYVTELINLIETLIKQRLIIIVPLRENPVYVVGKASAKPHRPGVISINDGKEFVVIKNDHWAELVNCSGQQTHWLFTCTDEFISLSKVLNSWFSISQELKDLVKNNFKTEEQVRFEKQQRLTWISIGVAAMLGLLGVFFKQ